MFQGNALEAESRATYSLISGNEVQQVGMVFQDDSRRVGASPDGIILDLAGEPIGGLELKTVQSNTLVEYLYTGGIPAKYRPQVYGSLYVSGLNWWDFAACSSGLPPHIVRVENTDDGYLKYAEALDRELPKFLTLLDDIIETVRSKAA